MDVDVVPEMLLTVWIASELDKSLDTEVLDCAVFDIAKRAFDL